MPGRCACSTTAGSTAGKACSTSSTPSRSCAGRARPSRPRSRGSGRTWIRPGRSPPSWPSRSATSPSRATPNTAPCPTSTAAPTCSSRRPTRRASPTRSWRRWRPGSPRSRATRSASPTACATARTGFWSIRATSRRWLPRSPGSSRTTICAAASPRPAWRSAAGSIPGMRWGGRSWTSTPGCARNSGHRFRRRPALRSDLPLPRRAAPALKDPPDSGIPIHPLILRCPRQRASKEPSRDHSAGWRAPSRSPLHCGTSG